ncbi:MAG: epoxyqueuosine reductase QueH [Desulfobacterales bacterium]|nr:epoxyqueuosine reductase QueH [Desulfobacterales bacterium]
MRNGDGGGVCKGRVGAGPLLHNPNIHPYREFTRRLETTPGDMGSLGRCTVSSERCYPLETKCVHASLIKSALFRLHRTQAVGRRRDSRRERMRVLWNNLVR